jgi:photosystem II stability/assembly factor-like uncharacterized protein
MRGKQVMNIQPYVVFLFVFTLGFGSWESLGPYGGQMRSFDVAPTNEDIILAASNYLPGRLFTSTDNGSTWQDAGYIPYYINAIIFDPTNENTVYIGTYEDVLKSTNGGATWIQHPVSETYINELAIHPDAPHMVHAAASIVYGATEAMGYYRSTNGGVSWSSTVLDTLKGATTCIACCASDPSIVCVGGNSMYNNENFPRVYWSVDSGVSFFDIGADLPVDFNISTIRIHPFDPDIVYVASFYPGDIYRTTNSGQNWTLVQSAPFVTSLAISPATPNTVYAGADTVIFKSTNAGATWFNCGSGYSSEVKQPRHVVASMTDPSSVYCIDFFGFSRSTNAGTTWAQSNEGITLASIFTLECAPSLRSTIYAALDVTGVIKSTNSGNTWTLLPEFLSCGNICAFAIHNTSPDTVLALEGSG